MSTLLAAATFVHEHFRDHGPIYVETRGWLANPHSWLVEPYNAVSALLFLAMVVYWLVALRGQFRRYRFIAWCLPLLAVGGVGGTVYHALRVHMAFLIMDWLPILLLCVAGSVFLWLRVLPRWYWVLVIIPLFLVIQITAFRTLPHRWAINASYSVLALLVATPAVIVLVKTRFRHLGWLACALGCFVLAVANRAGDAWPEITDYLPMGCHWLWHVFGALAAQAVIQYFYLLIRDERAAGSAQQA